MQHFSVPAHELTEDVFEDGSDSTALDSRFQNQKSDILLIPDPNRGLDPSVST